MNGGTYVEVTSDDGFIVTGQHQSSGAGACDIYVFKRDACGNTVWFNTYGGGGDDGGMCIRETSDGGFILTGLSQQGSGGYDMALIKLDINGNVTWSQDFGGPSDDRGLQVQETMDGGYIVSGHTQSFGAGSWDAYLIKTDINGNLEWSKTYGGGGDDYGNYVQQTPDGGYIIMGSTSSFGAGSWDLWMIRINSQGNIIWNKTYGAAGAEGEHWHTKGLIASDGNYVIASYTSSFGAGSNDYLLIKTDTSGTVLWSKTYGGVGDDNLRFITETADRGFALTGYTTSFGFGGNDYYLVKTDSSGDVEWSRVYGGAGAEKAMGVQQSSDGGYVMCGNSSSFSPAAPGDPYDAYFVKTDSLGKVGDSCYFDTAATIMDTAMPIVNTPSPAELNGATVVNVTPVVIPYTPLSQVLCLFCDVSFASFKYCDNGLTVTFIDSSLCATAWDWDFGDGFTDTIPNPTHTYLVPGTYNAQLVAQNVSYGCDDTLIIPLTLDTAQVADFSSTTVCIGDLTVFTDLSDTSKGDIIAWWWDFGDGDTSTFQNTWHVYGVPGTYTVSLAITLDQNNCTDTVTHSVIVTPLPVVDFTSYIVCAGIANQFTNTSTINYGTIASWLWIFGDGDSSTTMAPAHVYDTGGTYLVTLVAISDNGCMNSTSKNVIINYLPTADFDFDTVCFLDTMPFYDLSTVPSVFNDNVSSWLWDFGDGFSSSAQNPGHHYKTQTNFTVTLSISTDSGCLGTISKPIGFFNLPVAAFSNTTICVNEPPTVFTDLSTITPDILTNWEWDFGDGSVPISGQDDNPSYSYGNDGLYNVELIVTTNNGCKDTVNQTVEVYSIPIVNFTADTLAGCAPLEVAFTNNSTNDVSYQWDLGDGTNTASENPVHSYIEPDPIGDTSYHVQLIVTSPDNCVDTVTYMNYINIWPNPIAEFTLDPEKATILFPYIIFTNTSSGDLTPPVTYTWNFGDGSPDYIGLDTTHVYSDTDTGTYTIQLIVENGYQCLDTITTDLSIEGDYTLFMPNAFTPNGDGINDTFFPLGIGLTDPKFEYTMYIYDRWGDLIFKSDDINKPWDGKANNGRRQAQADVYVWVIKTIDTKGTVGQKHQYIGHVTLFRQYLQKSLNFF